MTAPTTVPARAAHQFATYIPDRRPQFKTHSGIGHAKSAVLCRMWRRQFKMAMTMYRLVDGQYEPWIQIAAGSQREDYPDLTPPAARPGAPGSPQWEIQRLAEQERHHLQQAAQYAEKRRALESTR